MKLSIRMRRALAAFRRPVPIVDTPAMEAATMRDYGLTAAGEVPSSDDHVSHLPASPMTLTEFDLGEAMINKLGDASLQLAARRAAEKANVTDPRNVAKTLLLYAEAKGTPSPLKANLRVEAMMLRRFMDMVFGPETGEVQARLKTTLCPDCGGTGETIEGYSNGAGRHCERNVICTTCDGEGNVPT